MEPITTLFDTNRDTGRNVLTEDLRILYGGDLEFPEHSDRPYVIGNFVSTLDGVVSFAVPGKSGGGDISGFNETDRFIMGLLRASADAVMVGARTLQEVAPGYLWSPEHAYPKAQEHYAKYRHGVLNKPEPPWNVIVSGSGALDLQRAVFRARGVKTLVITSPKGAELLSINGVAALDPVEVRAIEAPAGKIPPAPILELLRDEFAVKLLLHEGGPALFGDFVAHGRLDELFLTVAPQFAGRDTGQQRPGVISGVEFMPETAPWLKLASVKQSGDHLYLRYGGLTRRATSEGPS
ncbi:MAG: dihydrofolate reductase family protein [Bryobacterales bacterium]